MQIKNCGESVILYVRTQTGTDAFNRPVYTEIAEKVDNVFVGVPDTAQVLSELNMTGHRIAHILGIPAGDAHDWQNVTVEFHGRKWRTYGAPISGTPALMPFGWHTNVMVESYE